jgi:two-component system, chemotaxis family, chemotaxis protein CheY
MKILIVDDDFTSRKILQVSLQSLGVCDMACNGEEAYAAVQLSRQEGKPYDLILLDIMMPGMDGNEVLRRIRTEEDKAKIFGTDRVKIAMATCLNDKDHVIGSFHDGCDGYILKPYTPTSIHQDLKRHGLIH